MNDRRAAPAAAAGLPPVAAAGLLIALTAALYWPALRAGFVGDDFMILHRLRGLTGPADALRFFRSEFFEYYRPLGFLSHAVDWAIGGAGARQFHLTNLLLHTIDAVLVLLIGRALSPRSLAGPLAALLFAVHASNAEAVVWVSARFDLLAACFALAAIFWMVRGLPGEPWVSAPLFFAAVLAKESAVALPVAAAAWSTFGRRASGVATLRRVVPWMIGLAAYSALRSLAGGLSPVGGAARLPKLVALCLAVAGAVVLADGRWLRVASWLRERRTSAAALGSAVLAATTLAAAWSDAGPGRLAREKLSVAGFAIFHLVSPVLGPTALSDPSTTLYWTSGVVGLALVIALLLCLWKPLLDDGRMWFLWAFLAATLLPISALTEGKRYLYLPSAACSLIVGVFVAELRGRARIAGMSIVASVLAVSAVQVSATVRDWVWAGRMTADGARLVDAAIGPRCGDGHVVFLTSPVALRGVATHFYYETFEGPRGCMPAVFQVVARMVRVDTPVDARWSGPGTIVIRAPEYRGNLVLSADLRQFDTPLRTGGTVRLDTPLGEVRAGPAGRDILLTLTLAPDVPRRQVHFFFYSNGRIQALPDAE